MPASRGPDGSKTCCFLLSGIHRVLFSVSFLCMLSPCLSSCFHLDRHGSLRHIEAQRHCRIRIRTQGFRLPAQSSCPWTRLPGGREGRTLPHPTLPCRRGPSSGPRSPIQCPSAMMLWGLQGQLFHGHPLSTCSAKDFSTHSPLLLFLLPTATRLWRLLQEKERSLIDGSIFIPSFSRSVNPTLRTWGPGP